MGYRIVYFADKELTSIIDIEELAETGRYGWFRANGDLTVSGLRAIKHLFKQSENGDCHVLVQATHD